VATVVRTVGIEGIEGYPIAVQVNVIGGPAVMNIVGLGDQAVREAKDRIESAFDQLGLKFPKKKIIVNLSPSDIKKSGTYFDLPMLIGLMLESEQLEPIDIDLDEMVFIGEVGLTGELAHFKGVLPMVIEARRRGYKQVVLPKESLMEASRVDGIELFGFSTLYDVVAWLERRLIYEHTLEKVDHMSEPSRFDFIDVVGHGHMMKYITAAAAGAHNMLMIGPPGCGKSMIAKRFPSILPDLTKDEAIEVMAIQSVSGTLGEYKGSLTRPFRAPHYNTSPNAIIGGGTYAMPGEISLAHNGVLFLDELPEFSRQTIDSLRQPLEDHVVTVARVKQTNTYPANFMLIAAMNPCKCGHCGTGACKCSPSDVRKYRQRISGPIYDRMDIQKYLGKVDVMKRESDDDRLSSAAIRLRVLEARRIQEVRFEDVPGIRTNAQMESMHIKSYCKLDVECEALMQKTYEKYPFSARSYNKIMNLSRTFADMDGAKDIRKSDVVSALMARDLDKEDALKIGD